MTEIQASGLVPFGMDASCQQCGRQMNICEKRPLGQKFYTPEGTFCIECQEVLGIEPVYVPSTASADPTQNPAYTNLDTPSKLITPRRTPLRMNGRKVDRG